jgi:TonB family protein
VRLEDLDLRGSLTRGPVRRVVRRGLGEVRGCHAEALAARPSVGGRVVVSFVVSSTGLVQTSSLMSTTLDDRALESCIVQTVRRWRFPAREGASVVVAPFALELRG